MNMCVCCCLYIFRVATGSFVVAFNPVFAAASRMPAPIQLIIKCIHTKNNASHVFIINHKSAYSICLRFDFERHVTASSSLRALHASRSLSLFGEHSLHKHLPCGVFVSLSQTRIRVRTTRILRSNSFAAQRSPLKVFGRRAETARTSDKIHTTHTHSHIRALPARVC